MRQLRAEEFALPVVALLTLAVDQVSKGLIVTRMELGQSVDLVSWLAPVMQLTYVTNTGAVFGLLPGMGNVLVVVAVLVVVILLLYHRHLPPGYWPVRFALGLKLGGALGNLADRLSRGSVVDFLDMNFWPLQDWPVFNLADASIVAGVVLLGATMLWQHGEQEEQGEHGDAVAEKSAL